MKLMKSLSLFFFPTQGFILQVIKSDGTLIMTGNSRKPKIEVPFANGATSQSPVTNYKGKYPVTASQSLTFELSFKRCFR